MTITYGIRVPPAAVACPEDLQCPVIQDGALYTQAPTLKLRVRAFVKNFALVFYGFYAWNALQASDDEPTAEAGKELHSEAEKAALSDDERIALYRGFLRFVSDRFGDATRPLAEIGPVGESGSRVALGSIKSEAVFHGNLIERADSSAKAD